MGRENEMQRNGLASTKFRESVIKRFVKSPTSIIGLGLVALTVGGLMAWYALQISLNFASLAIIAALSGLLITVGVVLLVNMALQKSYGQNAENRGKEVALTLLLGIFQVSSVALALAINNNLIISSFVAGGITVNLALMSQILIALLPVLVLSIFFLGQYHKLTNQVKDLEDQVIPQSRVITRKCSVNEIPRTGQLRQDQEGGWWMAFAHHGEGLISEVLIPGAKVCKRLVVLGDEETRFLKRSIWVLSVKFIKLISHPDYVEYRIVPNQLGTPDDWSFSSAVEAEKLLQDLNDHYSLGIIASPEFPVVFVREREAAPTTVITDPEISSRTSSIA